MPVVLSGVMFGVEMSPERGRHIQAPGKGLPAGRGMAGDAVAGRGQVLATGNERVRLGRSSRGSKTQASYEPHSRTRSGPP